MSLRSWVEKLLKKGNQVQENVAPPTPIKWEVKSDNLILNGNYWYRHYVEKTAILSKLFEVYQDLRAQAEELGQDVHLHVGFHFATILFELGLITYDMLSRAVRVDLGLEMMIDLSHDDQPAGTPMACVVITPTLNSGEEDCAFVFVLRD